MKKGISFAILAGLLAACYTPLNNSGVATTKPWLEISGKKTDFDGKQYDSCYRFNVRFWPQEAAEKLDLQDVCISACCWRSQKEEVTLDFNKNFEKELAAFGRARKYTPAKITLKVNHSDWLNTTRVTISPKGAVSNDGLIKLSYKNYEDPKRLAQLDELARRAAQRQAVRPAATSGSAKTKSTVPAVSPAVNPAKVTATKTAADSPAKTLVQRVAGAKIDTYFYQMDKRYKKQGAVFLLSERLLHVQPSGEENIYMVSCLAKARTGIDLQHLHASTFPCGQWHVDTAAQTVTPYDARAQLIWGM